MNRYAWIASGRLAIIASAAAQLLLVGCVGRIGDETNPQWDDANPNPYVSMRDGEPMVTDEPGSGPGSDLVSCIPQVPDAPLQRITRAEYDNSVFALAGILGQAEKTFVADERVEGFVANSIDSVGETHVYEYMTSAENIAERLDIEKRSGCTSTDSRCLRDYALRFAAIAFRRALSTEESDALRSLFNVEQVPSEGVRVVVEATLQAPQFLYRLEALQVDEKKVPLTARELGTRLAHFLWNAPPDEELQKSIDSGALTEANELQIQAERMLSDQKALEVAQRFIAQWLHIEEIATTERSDPDFSPALREGLVHELPFLASMVLQSDRPYLNDFFFGDVTIVNDATKQLYGDEVLREKVSAPDLPAGFEAVRLAPENRRGLITSASLLSTLAHDGQTAPIIRGAFVRDRLICVGIPTAPAEVNAIAPVIDNSVSVREQYAQHRIDPSCEGCHSQIDPIGFGLDVYDHLGRPRNTDDNGFVIDGAGQMTGSDVDGPFVGGTGLADRLKESKLVSDCTAEMWLTYALGRALSDADHCTLERLKAHFEASDYNLHALVTGIVLSDAFRFWRVEA